MIKLIVDSTTDLPNHYFKTFNIDIVPLNVNINGKTYRDNIDISLDEIYHELRNGSDIKTSQPNIQDIYDIFEKYVQNNDDIIFLTISSKISGTYQTIYMISEEMKEKYPNVRISIIDSKGGSGISGLMALQASLLIEKNETYDNIIAVLNELTNSCEHIFTVNDLKYLFKSGRLGRAAALIGNLLRVKPILDVQDGQIRVISKVRGSIKALTHIVDLLEERINAFPDQIITIMHANDLEVALKLKEMIIDRIGEKKFIIDQIGSVLGTHLGIGGVGVFFFSKKPKLYINNILD